MISRDGRGAGRITKSGFKSIIASVLIIAMLLSTMGGATYSWFSDSVSFDVEVRTGNVDYGITIRFNHGTEESLSKTPTGMNVVYENKGSLPIKINARFWVEMYYTGTDRFGNGHYYYYNQDGLLKESANHNSIDNNTECFVAYYQGNEYKLGPKEDEKNVTLGDITCDVSRWYSDSITLEIASGQKYSMDFDLRFSGGTYQYDDTCDIPIQFYTMGVQSDYRTSGSGGNTTGLGNIIDVVHSEFQSDNNHDESTIGHSSIAGLSLPDDDIVGTVLDESKMEAGIQSYSCIRSRIEEESCEINYAPMAVALRGPGDPSADTLARIAALWDYGRII